MLILERPIALDVAPAPSHLFVPDSIVIPGRYPVVESPAVQLARELAHDPFSPKLTADPAGIARLLLEAAVNEGSTERSQLHAHHKGLHSIMLYDRGQTQGGKIRLFYTQAGLHTQNRFYDARQDFSCWPHDHLFDVALVPLVGDLLHIRTEESSRQTAWDVNKFEFTPAVNNGGEYDFERLGPGPHYLKDPCSDQLVASSDVEKLEDGVIHSVVNYVVGEKSTSAWLVVEGPAKDKPYILYSKNPKPPRDASGLYQPAMQEDIERIIGHTLQLMQAGDPF